MFLKRFPNCSTERFSSTSCMYYLINAFDQQALSVSLEINNLDAARTCTERRAFDELKTLLLVVLCTSISTTNRPERRFGMVCPSFRHDRPIDRVMVMQQGQGSCCYQRNERDLQQKLAIRVSIHYGLAWQAPSARSFHSQLILPDSSSISLLPLLDTK